MTIRTARTAAPLITALALLATAAPASAGTTRYASSTGTALASCSSGSPCDVATAVAASGSGDTVILAPGSYVIPAGISFSNAITIEGQPGQPRPQLYSNGLNSTIDVSGGATVSHLYLESDSTESALTLKGATGDDVIAYSPLDNGVELKTGQNSGPTDTLFRDSIASTDGSDASAIEVKNGQATGNVKILNVSALGRWGQAAAISSKMSSGSLSIVNTIARGADGGDIVRTQYSVPIGVSYSAFRPFASSGLAVGAGDLCAASPFVDSTSSAANADLHEAPGSPTIDAGTNDGQLGAGDPDGNARTQSVRPDIGAYESPLAGTGAGTSSEGFCNPANRGDGGGLTSNPGPGTGGGGAGATGMLPPSVPPSFGARVTIGPASGTVTVRLPGSSVAVPLAAGATIPVGSVIDATHGVVDLTSVRDRSNTTQTGRFWGGAFEIGQNPHDGYTELALAGGAPRGCGARGRLAVSAAGHGARSRSLWGSDHHGHFRTRGSRAIATVRGTVWLTQDRCDGTLAKVRKGAIVVRDLGRRRNVLLTQGHSYLAKAGRHR